MPEYKISILMEQGKNGWSEQWYRFATSPVEATVLPRTALVDYLQLRADATILRGVRASDVASPRTSFYRAYNVNGVDDNDWGDATGEPPGVCLLAYLTAQNFRHRSLMLRGLGDAAVARNSAGAVLWTADLMTGIEKLKRSILAMGFKMRVLSNATVPNPDRVITELSPGNGSALTTSVAYTGAPIPVGQRVIFHGLDRGRFPGMGSALPVIAAGAGTITVPVPWRSANVSAPGLTATVRVADYTYALIDNLYPQDIRTRKVGRPSLLSRGRRSTPRLRAV